MFVADKGKVSQLRERYNNRTPIIYQGSMSEERGLFHMIAAMKIIKSKREDVILLLIGQLMGSLLEKVNDLIKKNSLEKYIEIVGWLPHKEIVNYISISRVGLVPFLQTKKFLKNIPVKQFEYMACGVPVLGSDLPPIASYINEARCGKVFDSRSPEALAFGVLGILKDEAEWKRMSEAGVKAVRNLWNWDKMEKALFQVYEGLLRR
jgi:glycosyltransferase involved in cell wall biosynthesis